MVDGGSRQAHIRTSDTWNSKPAALPLFYPCSEAECFQVNGFLFFRFIFVLFKQMATDRWSQPLQFNCLSLLFAGEGSWPMWCQNSVSNWHWNDRGNHLIINSLLCGYIALSLKSWQFPHLLSTTSGFEVFCDWTAILSQRQRNFGERGRESEPLCCM